MSRKRRPSPAGRSLSGGVPLADATTGAAPFADEPTTPGAALPPRPMVSSPPGAPAWGPATVVRDDDDARLQLDAILRAAGQLHDPVPLLSMLSEKAPVALAEVTCGPRAPGGAAFVRASLRFVDQLEAQLSPRGLYGRLLELCGDAGRDDGTAIEVLRVGATRHPAASWVVRLSRKVEGIRAGTVHLAAAAVHPAFAQACVAHAEVGHVEGLLSAAASTGRGEPAAALLAVDPALAVRAAALALCANPQSTVVAHLAAAWGPDVDGLVARVVPHLRHRAAAEALLGWTGQLPHTARLLRAVIPGMAS
mgnify:CR=1 FL=1